MSNGGGVSDTIGGIAFLVLPFFLVIVFVIGITKVLQSRKADKLRRAQEERERSFREQEEQRRRQEEKRQQDLATENAHLARLAAEEAARKQKEVALQREREQLLESVKTLRKSLDALDSQLALGEVNLAIHSARKSEMENDLVSARTRLRELGVEPELTVSAPPPPPDQHADILARLREQYVGNDLTREEYESLKAMIEKGPIEMNQAADAATVDAVLRDLEESVVHGLITQEAFLELKRKYQRG